jgi:hypothetical protein
MQYVDGMTLAQLAQTGPLPFTTTVHIASQLLAGLDYLHQVRLPRGKRGVAHFNMTPHNVLLSFDGLVKIADFGEARLLSGQAIKPPYIFRQGEASYTAPEQLYAQEVDARADLFAVGAILWELLAGKPLFAHESPEAMAAELNFQPMPRPGIRRPEVSPELEQVIMRLLACEPGKRYQAAAVAISDLARCPEAPQDGARDLAATIAERIAPKSSRQQDDDERDGEDDEPRRSTGRDEQPRALTAAPSPTISVTVPVRPATRPYALLERARPEPRTFSHDEYRALVGALEYSRDRARDLAIAHMLYHCKFHVATAVGLTIAQLHLGRRVLLNVRLPGSSDLQDVPLDDLVHEALEQYIPYRRANIGPGDSTALFLRYDGEPLPLDDARWILSCHSPW